MSTTLKRQYHSSFVALTERAHEASDGDSVRGYSILTTDLVIFEALENPRGHSTTSSFEVDGETIRLAPTTSRPLPEWIDEDEAYAYGTELRIAAVRSWHLASEESAREMISEAYPIAETLVADGLASWRGGRLETTLDGAARLVAS